jgi:hypothetical protein
MFVRLAVAGQRALDDDASDMIDDGWQAAPLDVRTKAALAITDAALVPRPLTADERTAVDAALSLPEQAEAALAAGIFDGFARAIVIGLGLEPPRMRTMVVPAPFS